MSTVKSENNFLAVDYTQWQSINDHLEKLVSNNIWGQLIRLVNKIRELVGASHFETNPECVLPSIKDFVSRWKFHLEGWVKDHPGDTRKLLDDPRMEEIRFRFSSLMASFSWERCTFDQAQKTHAIMELLEINVGEQHPPRKKRVSRKMIS